MDPFTPVFEALDGAHVRYVVVGGLIALKRMAQRPQDLLDIEALEEIARRRGGQG